MSISRAPTASPIAPRLSFSTPTAICSSPAAAWRLERGLNKDHRIWCVLSAPNPFTRAQRFVAEVADRGCRSQRLRLQIAAFEENSSGAFHLLKRSIDVARFKLNSAAAIQDNMRIQAEV